ncbi:hypothetical protein BDP27DRAFT_1405701, partial [Rhodocollybia butyracea]
MANPVVISTLGPWFISYSFLTVLYGMGLLQTWLYFHWYYKDHWILKTIVTALIFFESVQTILLCVDMYITAVNHFGELPYLSSITWTYPVQQLSSYLSETTVQMYFAYVVYSLNDRKLGIVIPIFLLAVLGIAAGLGISILLATYGIAHGGIELTALPVTKTLFNLQLPATFACDLLITVSLCIILRAKRHKTARYHSTINSILQKLMVNAVNRGLLTTITAAVTLIVFLALPGTFYFYLGVLPSSKLYMNSMLAMLNS